MFFKSSVKKILLAMTILLVIPGLLLLPADEKITKKTVVKKGAEVFKMKGTLRNWSDCKKITFGQDVPRRKRPVLNFEDPRKIKKSPTAIDPVAQTDFGPLKRHTIKAVEDLFHFEAMNLNDNGAGWPPDTNGDVGSTYFIQTVNTSIGIYNKSTGALVSATTFDDFFEGPAVAGTPCDEHNNGDVIVLYDQYHQRWFLLDFAWYDSYTGGSYYSIAVSQTSDPTGSWYMYAFNADPTLMNDYPKCGVWHDGIYVTANMFQFSGYFQHVKVWALKTPELYSGTLIAQSLTDGSYEAFSLLPANAKGTTPPATSEPNYMFAEDADEFGPPSIDAIYVWEYDVDWAVPANTTWTGPVTLVTAPFGLTGYRIPQQGTSNQLDSLYGRLMFPAQYRNFGTHASVYLNHVCEHAGKRAERWYEVRIIGGTPSIYQQGTYSPDVHHRWMGAVGGDKYGNIALGYSVCSSTMYPSIRVAGRLSGDPLGILTQGEMSVIEGSGHQTVFTRWGDYSSMSIDPDDDETFWYTQEYYSANGTNWQTRVASFKITPAPPPPPVISDVMVTNLTDVSATITWNTDLAATSGVEYGLKATYGDTESDSTMTLSHSITLTGLMPETTYHFRVWSATGSGTAVSVDYTFTTFKFPPVVYCESSGGSSFYEWIAGVEIGPFSHTSGASTYSDFTSIVADLETGGTYDVTLTPGFYIWTYTEYWRIWIDFNVDGDFDDTGEEVFSGWGSSDVTGSITLPDVKVKTRMRVSMKWLSYATPCDSGFYGEVEDYTVNINDLSTYSLFAINGMHLKTSSTVDSGDVAVMDVMTDPWINLGTELIIALNVYLEDGVDVYANEVKLKPGASVDNVFCNDLTNNGTIRGDLKQPVGLPLGVELPTMPTPAPGTTDITIGDFDEVILDAGAYGMITGGMKSTLVFTGGTYHVEDVNFGDYAELVFQAPTELIVNGKFFTGKNPKIGPETSSGLTAKDIVFYVNGSDGVGEDRAVIVGIRQQLKANIFAPNGTIWLKARGTCEGAFIGLNILVEFYTQIILDSAF